jgi:hypothetical protein
LVSAELETRCCHARVDGSLFPKKNYVFLMCELSLADNSDRWDVRIAFLAAVPVELAFFDFVFVVVWSGRLSGGGDG